IEKLEHQSRRPDILIDDELIYAFYDAKIPADVSQTASLEKWFKGLSKEQAATFRLNRDDLMRHDAAGITTDAFPRQVARDDVTMALEYHFEPGSLRDGVTLTILRYHLNIIDVKRCEWLVSGMLKEKVLWLLWSLPERLRRHRVPICDYAGGFLVRWFEEASELK